MTGFQPDAFTPPAVISFFETAPLLQSDVTTVFNSVPVRLYLYRLPVVPSHIAESVQLRTPSLEFGIEKLRTTPPLILLIVILLFADTIKQNCCPSGEKRAENPSPRFPAMFAMALSTKSILLSSPLRKSVPPWSVAATKPIPVSATPLPAIARTTADAQQSLRAHMRSNSLICIFHILSLFMRLIPIEPENFQHFAICNQPFML